VALTKKPLCVTLVGKTNLRGVCFVGRHRFGPASPSIGYPNCRGYPPQFVSQTGHLGVAGRTLCALSVAIDRVANDGSGEFFGSATGKRYAHMPKFPFLLAKSASLLAFNRTAQNHFTSITGKF